MENHEPIQRRKLAHEIKDRLIDMIQSGEFKVGDTMPSEHDLMKRYNVGRPSVREAMQALDNMGLISIQHGEKAKVKRVTAEDIICQIDPPAKHLLSSSVQNVNNLREARHIFETGVVIIATQRASSNDITKLKEKLDQMRRCKNNRIEFVEADIAFHTTIAEITGNPIIVSVSKAMFHWLKGYNLEAYEALLYAPGLQDLTIDEHENVLNCITVGDAIGASRAISDHILRANKIYSEARS